MGQREEHEHHGQRAPPHEGEEVGDPLAHAPPTACAELKEQHRQAQPDRAERQLEREEKAKPKGGPGGCEATPWPTSKSVDRADHSEGPERRCWHVRTHLQRLLHEEQGGGM